MTKKDQLWPLQKTERTELLLFSFLAETSPKISDGQASHQPATAMCAAALQPAARVAPDTMSTARVALVS